MTIQYLFIILMMVSIVYDNKIAFSVNSDESLVDTQKFHTAPICSVSEDGYQKAPCPTQNPQNPSWVCIRYGDLCNSVTDCPNGEDELAPMCYYHSIRKFKIDQMRTKLELLRSLKEDD